LEAPESSVAMISDDELVSTIYDRIATDRNWTVEERASDLSVLDLQRLRTVRDLRALSKKSWKDVPLLPLVKDLLVSQVHAHTSSKKTKNKERG
jgi:hypothetical protein